MWYLQYTLECPDFWWKKQNWVLNLEPVKRDFFQGHLVQPWVFPPPPSAATTRLGQIPVPYCWGNEEGTAGSDVALMWCGKTVVRLECSYNVWLSTARLMFPSFCKNADAVNIPFRCCASGFTRKVVSRLLCNVKLRGNVLLVGCFISSKRIFMWICDEM